MNWMSWYLGPVTVAVSIVGAALLVRSFLRGGRFLHVVSTLAILVPSSVLYLWRASAFPDHVWVTRRFLFGAFPALVLLAVGCAAYAFRSRLRGTRGIVVRVAAVAIAICAVAYPVFTVAGVQGMSEKRGFLAVVHDACRRLGPNAAVVVLDSTTSPLFDDWSLQTLRGFCGADVARIRRKTATTEELRRLAKEWAAKGRAFYVVAAADTTVRELVPDAQIMSTIQASDPHTLSQTLTHRPRGYRTESLGIVVARVNVD